MEGIQDIMSEPPVPDNHGFSVASYTDAAETPQRSRRDQSNRLPKLEQTIAPGTHAGFGIVNSKDDGGLVAHRGVLHEDEYVDPFLLRDAIQAELGYSYDDVSSAYALGRPSAEQLQLREKIDARLLELSRSGGNMEQLAKALGLSEKTIDRALARAREIDVQPMVPHGVIKSTFSCFKCGEPGTKRKRRFSQSPAQWVGTVVLCDADHRAGFKPKPGASAYWEFRDATRPLTGGVAPKGTKLVQRFPADYPDDEAYQRFIEGERTI